MQLSEPKIYAPNALPMYREDMPGRPLSKKRRAEKEAQDRKYQPAGGSLAKGELLEKAAGQVHAVQQAFLLYHKLVSWLRPLSEPDP